MANQAPESLIEAVNHFADEDEARQFVADLRWPEGKQVCPRCGSVDEHYFLSTRNRWKCKDCQKQFSVKVGTIFEDSPLSLSKWLPAMWMLVNCKNGISSYELARALDVTQKTAWYMLHRIRLAMQTGSFEKADGEVEVDETFIGGKARNMHDDKRERVVDGTGPSHQTAVMGLLERHSENGSQIRAEVLEDRGKDELQDRVRKHVEKGASVFTDALASYSGLDADYIHKVIDHAESYASGNVHTNGLENFWSLLKRAIKGTYVSVAPFHLFRYLDEQAFRFNHRAGTDSERFVKAVRMILHKNPTYRELTGRRV